MSSWRVAWNVLKAAGGLIVGTVTVLGWLSVTPEMVGQASYDAMRGPLPLIVMFCAGGMSGWGITRLWADRRERRSNLSHEAEVDEIRSEYAAELSKKDEEVLSLSKRPTSKDLDDAVSEATRRYSGRVDELTSKLSDAYREIDCLRSDKKVMTRAQLESFIGGLSSDLKLRLREIEKEGGSLRARRDGELSILEQYGILSSSLDDWAESTYQFAIAPDVRTVIQGNPKLIGL